MLIVVVKGVEEDTETDPLVAGAKHRAFQSLRLLKKLSFYVKTDIINFLGCAAKRVVAPIQRKAPSTLGFYYRPCTLRKLSAALQQ